jgi:hypothetical protein
MSDRTVARWLKSHTNLSYQAALQVVRDHRSHAGELRTRLELPSFRAALFRLAADEVAARSFRFVEKRCSSCGLPFYSSLGVDGVELGPECRGRIATHPDNAELQLWASRALATDDLTGGRVPGFSVLPEGGIRAGMDLRELDVAAQILLRLGMTEIDNLEDFVEYDDGHRFVEETAMRLLNDGEDADLGLFVATRWRPELVSDTVGTDVRALIFPWRVGTSKSLPDIGIPSFASRAVDLDQVIAVVGGSGTYVVNRKTAVLKDGEGSTLLLPAQTWRVGGARPTIARITLLEPTSVWELW